MKYDHLTKNYAKWLMPLVDRYDCGEWVESQGRPLPYNVDDRLNNWRQHDFPPSKITKTHLARHMSGTATVYYQSARSSGYALFMVDIDAHKGQTDAGAAAAWLIANYIPGAYSEPSTGGKGVHVYIAYKLAPVQRRDANHFSTEVGKAMAALVARAGFQSNVCGIYGTFTTVDRATQKIDKRGRFGKIPRLPDGELSLSQLYAMPVYISLRHVIRAASEVGVTYIPLPSLSPSKPVLAASPDAYGPARRPRLYARMKRDNLNLTFEEYEQAYEVLTLGNNSPAQAIAAAADAVRPQIAARVVPNHRLLSLLLAKMAAVWQ